MADQLVQNFAIRRPLLQHVATSLRGEFAEAIRDAKLQATVDFEVATSDQFVELIRQRGTECATPLVELVEQISGRIEIHELDQVQVVEKLVEQWIAIPNRGWFSETEGQAPIRKLHCVIPTQAKPDGWSARADVPNVFQLLIVVKPRPAPAGQRDETPLMRPSDDGAPTRALIMEGGGIKGLAYVGALEVLSGKYAFDWYVGTSAGAIAAVLLAAGYTTAEMNEILRAKNFKIFLTADMRSYSTWRSITGYIQRKRSLTGWMSSLPQS